MSEKRIDPKDDLAYTWEELSAYYEGYYDKTSIESYWKSCQPCKLSNVSVIKALTGESACEVCVAASSTVRELMLEIERATCVPVGRQQLTCSNRMFMDANMRLSTFVLVESIVVSLTVRAWTDEEIEVAKESVMDWWQAEDILATFGDDERVVMAAVQSHGWILQYASKEMQNNVTIVTAAVQEHGAALEHSSDDMKGNETVVTAAVQENGLALVCASDDMKGNETVVTTAINQNGLALGHDSEEMKNDP
jgi:hypothetical protein